MSIGSSVFADASFYTAALLKRDAHHDRALEWQRFVVRSGLKVVTTEAVLWEMLNSLSMPAARSIALQAYQRLHSDAQVNVIGFEVRLMALATQMYGARSDKSWGLTDCYSFVVMSEMKIAGALTLDHDFAQAGFSVLMANAPPTA